MDGNFFERLSFYYYCNSSDTVSLIFPNFYFHLYHPIGSELLKELNIKCKDNEYCYVSYTSYMHLPIFLMNSVNILLHPSISLDLFSCNRYELYLFCSYGHRTWLYIYTIMDLVSDSFDIFHYTTFIINFLFYLEFEKKLIGYPSALFSMSLFFVSFTFCYLSEFGVI